MNQDLSEQYRRLLINNRVFGGVTQLEGEIEDRKQLEKDLHKLIDKKLDIIKMHYIDNMGDVAYKLEKEVDEYIESVYLYINKLDANISFLKEKRNKELANKEYTEDFYY